MSPTDYLVGTALFAAMLAGTLYAAWLLLRRRYPQLTGVPRAVAYSMLATLGVLAVHVVPLALGVLDRATVIVATALWVVAARLLPAVAAEPDPGPDANRESGAPAWVLAGIALAAVAAFTLIEARLHLTVAPTLVDAMNFHLPGIGAWVQTGSLWQIDVFLSDVAPGHYPNNGDVLMLAAVLPWKSDFLTHLVMYPLWLLTGLSVYGLVAELRVPRATAAMTAALVLAIPSASIPALGGGFVDSAMLFGFATGLLFLVRHHRNGRTSELVLAGLSLGLAFGTKWYAVSAVPTVVAVWAVARLWSRRRFGECVRQTAALTGLIGLSGGIWLVRNLVESSNPVFPVKVTLLGSTIFDAPVDRIRSLAGFTIADYFGDSHAWREFILPQFRDALALPALLLALGVAVALVMALVGRRWGGRPPGTVIAGLVIAILLGVAYIKTPYTAGGGKGTPVLVGADARYVMPALIVAAPLTAWALARFKRGPIAFGLVGLVAVLEGLHQTQQGLHLGLGKSNVLGLLLGCILAVFAAAAVAPPFLQMERRSRVVLAGVAAVALLVGIAGAGRVVENRYLAHRYFGTDAVADALSTKARTGNRVGLSGIWTDEGLAPPLLAFGPRFGNHVAYVGWSDMDVPRRYPTRGAFARAVARGRYNWLVIGRGRPPKPTVNEERWAAEDGFHVVARSPRLTLFAKRRD